MKSKIFAVLTAALALSAPVWAHHSFNAAYDLNKPVTIKGKILQVRLQNPHSWFFLEVTGEDGKVEKWAFEAGTPSGMIRNGYKPNIIKQGAEVTIKGFRARDPGQKAGMLRELTTADGQVFGMFGPQEGSGN